MVAMLTHTPGPQVGLYKAHSGIKWWSSEKLEPRIPPCVNVSFVVWGCQSGCTRWWLYEVSGGCVEISPNVRKSAELRATGIKKVIEERKVNV